MFGSLGEQIKGVAAAMTRFDDGTDAAAVLTQLRAGVTALQGLCARPSTAADRAEWLALVEQSQAVVNAVTAAQDQAIVRTVCIDATMDEDGADVEYHRALGHISVDGPDLVGTRLCVARSFVTGRVDTAVRLAADRRPQYADDTPGPFEPDPEVGPGQPSGLSGLAAAMAAGRLDGYRAARVAAELVDAPAEVAEQVIAELESRMQSGTAMQLARAARTVLNRIAPDLVRARAERARKARSLRRWPGEPGVDTWMGSFPAEQAMTAWAAVDALAHDYVAAGHPGGIEAARADALIDLVTGNATINVTLGLTVPADALHDDLSNDNPADDDPGDGLGSENPAAGDNFGDGGEGDDDNNPGDGHSEHPAVGDNVGDGGKPDDDDSAGDDDNPGNGGEDGGDGGRPPANSPVPSCDTDDDEESPIPDSGGDSHEMPAADENPRPDDSTGEPAATATAGERSGGLAFWRQPRPETGDASCAGIPDALVEVMGPGRGEPVLASRAWLTRNPAVRFRTEPAACAPATGSLSDPDRRLDSAAYRPSAALTRLVKDRDGRCRFPGCTISVGYCDLDHVRPWPTGPTSEVNLLALCRRHHRIKQAPGWRVRLGPGAVATWTDPTGRDHITYPLDRLTPLILPAVPDSHAAGDPDPGEASSRAKAGAPAPGAPGAPSAAGAPGAAGPVEPAQPGPLADPYRDRFSVLEYVFEHDLNTHVKTRPKSRRRRLRNRHCWYAVQHGPITYYHPCDEDTPSVSVRTTAVPTFYAPPF
ncbi:hypothetical protein GCM10028781_14670 [Nostocoides australiense]